MSEERTLLDLAALLKSTKKKDRVKGLTDVSTLIEQDNIVTHLNKSSRKQSNATCWDILFAQVNEAVMGEIERGGYSGKLLLNMGQSLSSIVQKAHGLIKAKTLVSAVLSAFETQSALPADLCKIYFELAMGHLLELPKYRAELNLNQWTDLVNLCTLQYNNPRPGGSSLKFLELLCKVITSGVRYSLTIETLIDLLPFFKKILLSDLPPSASFEWNLLQAVNTTLLALVYDARYKVAEFTEAVIESVSRIHKSGCDINVLVFKNLSIAVNVHHPQGAGFDDPLYYAHDHNLWKEFLFKILHLCENEVCDLLRAGDKSLICDGFMTLFVDISHLMSLIRSTTPQSTPDKEVDYISMSCTARKRKSVDFMANPTQKRAKLVSANTSLSNVLADMSSKDYWFWLRYLAQLLERYPLSVKQDFQQVVKVICNLSGDVDSCPLGPLITCTELLFRHGIGSELSELWLSCFESLTRAVVKDNSYDQHRMLQILIRNHLVKDPASFLKLYVLGNIPCTLGSMETLATFVKMGATITEEERCILLRWGLCEIKQPSESAELVLALLFQDLPCENQTVKITTDFTNIYKSLTLNEEAVKHEEQLEETTPKMIYPNVADCLLEIISSLPQSSDCDYGSLVQDAELIELILRILSKVWRDESLKTKLLTFVHPLFLQFMFDCETVIRAKKPFRMEMISHLFDLGLNQSLEELIRSFVNENFLDMLLDLFKAPFSKDNEYSDNSNFLPFAHFTSKFRRLVCSLNQPDIEKIFTIDIGGMYHLRILNLLCQIGPINKLMTLIGEIKTDVSNFQIRVLLQSIYSITESPQNSSRNLNQCLNTLMSICRQRCTDNATLHICLGVIRELVSAIGNYGDYSTYSIFVTLMEEIRTSIGKRKGKVFNLVLLFIEILTQVCEFPQLAVKNWELSETRMVEDVFNYISNSSIFVRIAAARAVGKVLSLNSSHEILQRIRRQLLHPPVHMDDYGKMAVASSSLMTLAYALYSAGSTRFIAAFTTIDIIHAQNFDFNLVGNFLELLSRLLGCEDAAKYFKKHFKELLCEWFSHGNFLKDFPYPIVKCKNSVHFYNQFCDVIGAVCFVYQKREMLDEMAAKLNMSLTEVLEKSFPVIACMVNGELPAELSSFIPSDKQEVICNENLGKITFTVLRQSSENQRPSFFYQVIKRPKATQQTLLMFEEDLFESVTEEDVLESLTQYSQFVKKYVNEAKSNSQVCDVNLFVLRDTISVILRFLSGKHSRSGLEISCDLIKHIIDGFLGTHQTEINVLLPGVVNVLVALSCGSNCEPAVDLLRYLLLNKKEQFTEAISRLDPFPDDEVFNGLVDFDENSGLREVIARFTQIDGLRGRRVGGLARLLHALENHKEELRQLYEEAWTGKGLSEGTLLHDVLQQLVELCAHKNKAVRTEAAKCLGELGPTDLNTLVFKREEHEGSTYVAVEHRLIDYTLALLSQTIQTESLAVKKTACEALYRVMRFEGNASQCSRFCAPFCSQDSPRELVFSPNRSSSLETCIWLPIQEMSHDLWVQQLTTSLLETVCDYDGVSNLLQEMCQAHAPFAQKLLPLALGLLVEIGESKLVENVTQNINDFFASYISGNAKIPLKSVAILVEAIDYLRRWNFRRGNYGASLNDLKTSMQLDLLAIAEAAGSCGAHLTSMMFAEMWFQEQKTAYHSKQPEKWQMTVDDLPDRRSTLSRVMRSGFASIGVLDGLHGCGLSHLADLTERVTYLEQMGRWDMSLVMHDAMRNSAGVAKALLKFDLPHTLASLPGASDDQLTCAAKLGDWSLIPSPGTEPSFHLHHYSALKALHNRDMNSMTIEMDKATGIVLKRISENKMESPYNLYESLSQLQCLKQLWDVQNLGSLHKLKKKWELQDSLKPSEFSLLAKVLEVRCVIIKELSKEPNLLAEQHLSLGKLARRAGANKVAFRNILQLSELKNVRDELLLQGQVEEARYFWELGVHENATFLMSKLLNTLDKKGKNNLYAKCLLMYGKWMVERKMENPHQVIEKYFKTSLAASKNVENKLEAYAAMAKLADSNYIQLKEYLDSSNFENQENNLRQRKNCLENNLNSREDMRAIKEGENDLKEASFVRLEAKNFLALAIRYYALSLESGDKYDHFVFRLISLWLRNSKAIPEEEIAKIPSHKFILLLPQIIPRMHGDGILTRTVERILREHPYHTLPFLFALKNAHADQHYKNKPTKPPTPGMVAAYKLITATKETHPVMIDEMERFTSGLIELSNLEPREHRVSLPVSLDSSMEVTKLQNLNTVMMPGQEIPVQPSLRYENIVGVAKFKDNFELVGGVNFPKKIKCLGTDGKTRILLVKGGDDPRQDAFMQQVFTVINSVLARNDETARHKLSMRTYRVVPLSKKSGVIQWCENTQPLGKYLVGLGQPSGGAHERFRPNDIKPREARQLMGSFGQDPNVKLTGFLRICKRLQPVFHYFFLENFPSAGMAFERRLAYTRSVATSSMIGFILGLGDRHVMNILIDNVTGEVIHIDFGIAFDRGEVQKTPETVPFRLTRDIVDGMGLTGVDGVFRSCCKRTMQVLRENKDIIITLLEVLLYDPLDTWVINTTPATPPSQRPGEIFRDNKNAMAERAVSRVALKLQGLDKGVVTTVEGQVNGLIQQAMDPSRLSQLFVGWQPYL